MALRMLNDLALEPGRPDHPRVYQTPTSDCFQVFAFTSEGTVWNIYLCFRTKDIELKYSSPFVSFIAETITILVG